MERNPVSEALLAIPSDVVTLDVESLVTEALERWPEASSYRYDSGVVEVTIEDASAGQRLEMAFHASRQAVGLDGHGARLAAEAIAWLVRSAQIPPGAGAVVIEWADDLVPLDATTTADELMAVTTHW